VCRTRTTEPSTCVPLGRTPQWTGESGALAATGFGESVLTWPIPMPSTARRTFGTTGQANRNHAVVDVVLKRTHPHIWPPRMCKKTRVFLALEI